MFSMVIPTYNEVENIIPLLQQVHDALGSIPHELIVVDDQSPDGTSQLVQTFSEKNNWTRLKVRQGPRGLSLAVVDGFQMAQGDILGVMDADGSHDEKILPTLIAAIQSGADMAVGSRWIYGGGIVDWPWYRLLMSQTAAWLSRRLLGVSVSDPMSGYFVLTKKLFHSVEKKLNPQGFKIFLEIYVKSDAIKLAEIPFWFKDRQKGKSKMSTGVLVSYLQMIAAARKKKST